MSATTDQTNPPPKPNSTAAVAGSPSATNAGPPTPPKSEDTRKQGEPAKNVVTAPDASSVSSATAQEITTSETIGKATINAREEQNSPPPESTRPTNTQPPSANPTTQESFFKSVHKRLQMLESNSTLSLLYIEEQSRILRDAFNKVEKRQLAKTSTFLENLNVTVLNELREFREQYDHVWRSVALEFEHQRMEYHQEVQSISGQLGVLADELVFQKRVTVIQSIMVLCCFALALFSRGSGGNYMEFPAVQRMVARSYSLRSSSPIFASPSASPGSTRPTSSSYRENRGHRRNLSDSSDQDSAASPTAAYSPPTPTSSSSTDRDVEETDKVEEPASPESMSVPTLTTPQPRSQSTPPVLNGRPIDLDMTTPADVDLVTDLDNSRPPDL
ncbi:Sad1/UNC-like C-terminal [Penicillium expansum]|nr:Sad1/UNC-like C-terminal [Penicillium expansum]